MRTMRSMLTRNKMETFDEVSKDMMNQIDNQNGSGFVKQRPSVGWSDMIKLHDKFRALVSAKHKHKEKYMKKLQKIYLNKQIDENQIKKQKEMQFKEKDAWNTIELKGYNDDVLKRQPIVRSNSQVDNSYHNNKDNQKVSMFNRSVSPKVEAPDWNDPAIKYIKKSMKIEHDKHSKPTQKHFLYPLVNKTKRSQFRKMMELNCKLTRDKQVQDKKRSASNDNDIGDFEKKYNK